MNMQHGAINERVPDTLMDNLGPEGDGPGGLDIRAMVGMVWRGRWIIAACVLVAMVLAVLIVSQMRPSYRATATVFFEGQRANIVSVEDVVVGPDRGADLLENEIQILSSTAILGRVVDTLNLAEDRRFNPALRPAERSVLDMARSLADWRTYVSPEFLADLGIISPPPPPVSAEVDPDVAAARTRRFMIGILREGLTLRPVGRSRVIAIGFEGPDPTLAAAIPNTVADQYIISQLEANLTVTQQASQWLAGRVEELRVRVEEAELIVEQARTALAERAGETSEVTRQQITAITEALTAARAERARIEAQYESLAAALADESTDLGAVSAFRDAPVIRRLRDEESEIISRFATLQQFAPNNPTRVRLEVDLERLRSAVREEAGRIVAALRTDLDVARTRVAALTEEVEALQVTEQTIRRGEIDLRQLEREAQASRVLYENFLGRLQETSQQESLQTADARVLSPAEAPGSLVATAKNRVLAIAFILGIGSGVGVIVLLDRLNNTYRSLEHLEREAGQPVLATLPSLGGGKARAEVVAELREKPNGSLAEAVRNLRTSVLFSATGEAPKVVVFTSSVPREGKSTTSLLLALTSQQMGRSAIIVDCDLRLHALSNLVGEDDNRPGLLAVLDGEAPVEKALVTDPDTGLTILTAQSGERDRARSAADIVASQRFADLVTDLTHRYDLVVLDTPPALVVTDTRIIARLADAVVYAVKWDDTPRGAVLEGLREILSVRAKLAGLVLTMVDAKNSSYSYDGYGYYRSRYMDYYR